MRAPGVIVSKESLMIYEDKSPDVAQASFFFWAGSGRTSVCVCVCTHVCFYRGPGSFMNWNFARRFPLCGTNSRGQRSSLFDRCSLKCSPLHFLLLLLFSRSFSSFSCEKNAGARWDQPSHENGPELTSDGGRCVLSPRIGLSSSTLEGQFGCLSWLTFPGVRPSDDISSNPCPKQEQKYGTITMTFPRALYCVCPVP